MKRILYFVILFALIEGCQSKPSVTESVAFRTMDDVWNTFREQFNYHIQTVGLSDRLADGSYVLVIAEPPSQVSLETLTDFFDDYPASIQVKKHPFGYDGWVKDVVIAINGLDEDDMRTLLAELHKKLFFTDYKAYQLPLPYRGDRKYFLPQSLNVSVSVAELKRWLVDEKEAFLIDGKEGSPATTLSDLLDNQPEGLYYSKKPGLVVWVCPKDLAGKEELIRKFTLDTDLLLGAISGNDKLAIVARERELNVFELPPLRIETIQLLASAEGTSLSQSYERDHFLAGRLSDAEGQAKDWAPIYLSDELINTEYGSLLNVTDQMLKSWSNSGETDYEKFTYPKPNHWAFQGGVTNYLQLKEITYNWNTTAAAYTVAIDGGYTYSTITNTSALPVSYFPGNAESLAKAKIFRAEDMAHTFFANLNNPDLARVVQYAGLYQLFRKFGISCSTTTDLASTDTTDPASEHSAESTYLTNTIVAALQQLRTMDEPAIDKAVNQLIKKIEPTQNADEILDVVKSLQKIMALSPVERQVRLTEERQLLKKLAVKMRNPDFENAVETSLIVAEQVEKFQKKIDDYIAEFGSDYVTDLAAYLASPRDYQKTASEAFTYLQNVKKSADISAEDTTALLAKMMIVKRFKSFEELTDKDSIRAIRVMVSYGAFGQDLTHIRNSLVDTLQSSHGEWIKTPTVVVSWDNLRIEVVGGHNIEARMVPLEANAASATRGRFVINDIEETGRSYLIHPDDIEQLTPKFLRDVERTDAVHLGEPMAYDGKPVVIRARSEVIPFVDRTERGLTTTMRAVRQYEFNGKTVGSCDDLIEQLNAFARQNQAKHIELRLEGFSDDEARAYIKSSEIRYNKAGVAQKLVERNELSNGGVLLKKGHVFADLSKEYDFAKAEFKIVGEEMRIDIPHMTIPERKLSIWIRIANLTKEVKAKLIARLENFFKRNHPGDANFARTLKAEIISFEKEENVKIGADNLRLQIDDCLICLFTQTCSSERYA